MVLLKLYRYIEVVYKELFLIRFQYGDTPDCIPGKNVDFTNEIGTIVGFGKTEAGTVGELLEVNVTSISNAECLKQYIYNNTKTERFFAPAICKAIPDGFGDGMFCTKGIYNENEERLTDLGDKVSGETCKGDSGGPFKVKDAEGRRTLVGVVSGRKTYNLIIFSNLF